MATHTNIAVEESATVTARVASVQITRGSTNEQQEILVLGDANSSLALAVVSSAAPAANDYGLVVRPVGASTTVNVSSLAGTVSVAQASTVFQVQVGGYVAPSTTVQVSSLAGVVNVAQNSTVWQVQLGVYSTTVQVSSLGGTVAIAGNSTVTIGTELQSTSTPSTGSSGIIVRWPDVNSTTFAASTAFNNSSAITLASSNAASKGFVYAYTITSTIASAVTGGFYSAGTLLWPFTLQAASSAISGVNLALSPPGYLFKGSTGSSLTIQVATTNTGMAVGVAFWIST